MSVRSKLLAILTIGPAYGFQLHTELQSRTGQRRSTNVGQIYSTLERAIDQGAVRSAGLTPDGLPLYALTDLGRTEAIQWLTSTTSGVGDEWDDMLDRVLLSSSIPGSNVATLIADYRTYWHGRVEALTPGKGATQDARTDGLPDPDGQRLLAQAGAQVSASAALEWLAQAETMLTATGLTSFRRGLSQTRPRRGRRPAATKPSVTT
ncbi:PadR family transcriptional regulator [Leifsonia sp. A12D58]|uniref:PadR family transcriptional regulator n=1 Tax=Leifsonia sp. A12D58 TaxID=3397674 RepID=UPI0039E12FD9